MRRVALNFRTWFEANDDKPQEAQWLSDLSTYHRGLVRSDELNPGHVTVYPHEYYGEKGPVGHPARQVFHEPQGEVGYAILPHWDKDEASGLYVPAKSGRIELAGLYSHPTDPRRVKGWAGQGARRSIRQGVNYLEAFEKTRHGELPWYYYKQLGARPVDYTPWDDKYAHPKWNRDQDGRPGIVHMEIPPEGLSDLDRWFSLDHMKDPGRVGDFIERLRHFKREAGVPVDELDPKKTESKHHKHKKPYKWSGKHATPEEMEEMNRKADDAERLHFEFGIGGEPQIEAESKQGGKCSQE